MKASEYIEHLKVLIEKNGDLEVFSTEFRHDDTILVHVEPSKPYIFTVSPIHPGTGHFCESRTAIVL